MRSVVRILLILAFAFAQAASVECPMASAQPARAHHAGHAAHPEHASAPVAHHAHGHDAGGHRHDHPPAECALVMACGVAALPHAQAAAAQAFAPAGGARPWSPDPYASPTLAIDSPPPRASVFA